MVTNATPTLAPDTDDTRRRFIHRVLMERLVDQLEALDHDRDLSLEQLRDGVGEALMTALVMIEEMPPPG